MFAHLRPADGPRRLEEVPLPVRYSELTSANRYLVRARYVREQNGLCFYCMAPLSGEADIPAWEILRINPRLFPAGFFDHPIHLHHDHDTDLTLGAVHCDCNAVLWQEHGE